MTSKKKNQSNLRDYISMRYISLICLTLQTTVIISLYSYSRIIPKGSTLYLSSTVVVIAEILKIFFCLSVIYKDSGYSVKRWLTTLRIEILSLESLKVFIPASLYAIQNNLAFFALNNLDPASFQIAYQLKILSTAMFSVLLVNKHIRIRQWMALSLLSLGVALVQVDHNAHRHHHDEIVDKSRAWGFIAVIACCLSSGFSGVYFERLIKLRPKQSLWIRNLQLAIFCLLVSLIATLYQDYQAIRNDGFLQGYSGIVWLLVFLQTFGGLIVAAVVKHADNVLKGFATSISIILSTLVSYKLFDNFNPSRNFGLGASMVIISTLIYSS